MYSKIMVPLDGSPLSECVLEPAKTIVKALGLHELTLFMTVEPADSMVLRGGYGTQDRIKAQKQAESAEKDYLARIAGSLEAEGLKTDTVVTYGLAGEEILKYAKGAGVDLIIMSSHGRSGISRRLSGSVANKVINHSSIPVLIVPSRSSCRA
jgi:nucleotide-binding universal stress UspA family protein